MALEFGDLLDATRRIGKLATRTPLLEHPDLNELTGARVLLKLENLQSTGSFKFRGACNRLQQMTEPERRLGVVAWSSGNHAQGIAAAARLLGMPATVVMPTSVPDIKRRNTLAYGASVRLYDPLTESREAIARSLASELGAVLVPSYDDEAVMAGQGTCGYELFMQAEALRLPLDQVLVPCGGGGLLAGMATALATLSPGTRVFSVEPEGLDDHRRSFETGRRQFNSRDAASICDALLAPCPGELTFPVTSRLVQGGLTVSDEQVRAAMRFAWSRLKLVVEPGGAVALAAAMHHLSGAEGRCVAVVVSGGNVDADQFFKLIQDP